MVKNGTPASPAIARASKVLPVPGEPTSSAPLGILPPRRANLVGSFRNSTISCSSSRASSMPATSSKVTLPSLLRQHLGAALAEAHRARARGFFCIWRSTKKAMPRNSRNGSDWNSSILPDRRAFLRLGRERHVLSLQAIGQLRIGRRIGAELGRSFSVPVITSPRDIDVLDGPVLDLVEEGRIGDRVARRRLERGRRSASRTARARRGCRPRSTGSSSRGCRRRSGCSGCLSLSFIAYAHLSVPPR